MITRSRRERARDDRWATEESWWRQHYRTRPYVESDRNFTHYQPAFRYGFENARRYSGRHWDEVEPELRRGWQQYHRGELEWEQAKDSVRDAWTHAAEADRRR
jgi:hypothetical protein